MSPIGRRAPWLCSMTLPLLLPTIPSNRVSTRCVSSFVATFAAQCDAIRTLVDEMAALNPRGPAAALTQATHRLSGLAGTIGFPTISARASDLERLVAGAGGRGALDAPAAREAVDAIRNALAKDLAKVSRAAGLEGVRTAPSMRVLIVDDHAMVRRGLIALHVR